MVFVRLLSTSSTWKRDASESIQNDHKSDTMEYDKKWYSSFLRTKEPSSNTDVDPVLFSRLSIPVVWVRNFILLSCYRAHNDRYPLDFWFNKNTICGKFSILVIHEFSEYYVMYFEVTVFFSLR